MKAAKKTRSILKLAAAVAAAQAIVGAAYAADKAPAKGKGAADPKGSCYGVVGKGEGECGGRDPATGESWGCAGNNPTADLGFKTMKKSECDAAPLHKDATRKKFVPDPV
jgi:uncharacterized membrane protein